MLLVSCCVLVNFCFPVIRVTLGEAIAASFFTAVAVPKTAMHEHDRFPPGQDYVGFARQVGPMQPKAIPHPMHYAAHNNFRLRILTGDPPHYLGTTLFRDYVHIPTPSAWAAPIKKPLPECQTHQTHDHIAKSRPSMIAHHSPDIVTTTILRL